MTIFIQLMFGKPIRNSVLTFFISSEDFNIILEALKIICSYCNWISFWSKIWNILKKAHLYKISTKNTNIWCNYCMTKRKQISYAFYREKLQKKKLHHT